MSIVMQGVWIVHCIYHIIWSCFSVSFRVLIVSLFFHINWKVGFVCAMSRIVSNFQLAGYKVNKQIQCRQSDLQRLFYNQQMNLTMNM